MSNLQISWNATAGATFYRVYGSNDGINFSLIADNVTGLSYVHDAGDTLLWWYRITSCNATSESRPSMAVAPVNWPPTWLNTPNLTITQGGSASVASSVNDRDDATVSFSRIGGTAPAGVTCNAAGLVSVASDTAPGAYTAILEANDGYYGVATVECPIIVQSSQGGGQGASIAEIQAAGYLVLTEAPYFADNTGQQDVTTVFQQAIDDAFNNYKSLYIPAGEYKVSKTLRIFHWDNVIRAEVRTHFIQGCTTSPPVIKLSPTDASFDNPADPMPVVCVRAFDATTTSESTSPYDAQPTHPFSDPAGFRDASGMVVGTRVHSIVVNTNGRAGAIGMTWGIAQRGNCAQIKIIANNGTSHSFAGFCGPGGTHGTSNLEVIGGQYGIYIPSIRDADFSSGSNNSGIKLTGQTVANIAIGDFSPTVFTGCYFEMPPGGSVIKEITAATSILKASGTTGTRNCTPVFVDCVVKATTDSVAFPVRDNTIYLRNIHVTGTTQLIQRTTSSAVISAAGTWKCINEYSWGGGPCAGNTDGSYLAYAVGSVNLPHRTLIDGTLSPTLQAEVVDITPSSAAPASLTVFVEKHSHPPLPCIDNGAYCDVTNSAFAGGAKRLEFVAYRGGSMIYESYEWSRTLKYGDYLDVLKTNNRPVDAQPAIQAAIDYAANVAGHNRVFLPRGVYYISRPLDLKPHTQLFGAGTEKAVIAAMWDWLPTSETYDPRYMIRSADDAEGTASMSNFQIYNRKKFGTAYPAPNLDTKRPGAYVTNNLGATVNLYPYDFFCDILWRTGRKSWSHGVTTQSHWVDEYWPAQNRQKWTFTNNGGGRHWHLFSDGRSNCAAGFRIALAINTTQPLSLYAINVEAGKGVEKDFGYDVQANVELRGASNVRMYGSKREGNGATIWINGTPTNPANNIACYGPGVQQRLPFASGNPYGDDDAAYLAITGTVSDVLIAVSTVQQTDIGPQTNRLMLKEAITGQPVKRIYWPVGVALYKRGVIDDAAMDGIAPVSTVSGEYWGFPAESTYPAKSPYGGIYQMWDRVPRKGGKIDETMVDIFRIGGRWGSFQSSAGSAGIDWAKIETETTPYSVSLQELHDANSRGYPKRAILWFPNCELHKASDGTFTTDWTDPKFASDVPVYVLQASNSAGDPLEPIPDSEPSPDTPYWGYALWRRNSLNGGVGPRKYYYDFVAALGARYGISGTSIYKYLVESCYVPTFNAGGEFHMSSYIRDEVYPYAGNMGKSYVLTLAEFDTYVYELVNLWVTHFGRRASLWEGNSQLDTFYFSTSDAVTPKVLGELGLGVRAGNAEFSWCSTTTGAQYRPNTLGQNTVPTWYPTKTNAATHPYYYRTAKTIDQMGYCVADGKTGMKFYMDEAEENKRSGVPDLTNNIAGDYRVFRQEVLSALFRGVTHLHFPSEITYDEYYPADSSLADNFKLGRFRTLAQYFRKTAGAPVGRAADAFVELQAFVDSSYSGSRGFANIEKHLIQREVTPDGTTQLAELQSNWTQPDTITDPITFYSARRTNVTTGQRRMYFKVAAGFASPTEGRFQICVYYKNAAVTTWSIRHSTSFANDVESSRVVTTSSGTWNTAIFTFSSLRFNAAFSGMDFCIHNLGDSDLIVQHVRIIRVAETANYRDGLTWL